MSAEGDGLWLTPFEAFRRRGLRWSGSNLEAWASGRSAGFVALALGTLLGYVASLPGAGGVWVRGFVGLLGVGSLCLFLVEFGRWERLRVDSESVQLTRKRWLLDRRNTARAPRAALRAVRVEEYEVFEVPPSPSLKFGVDLELAAPNFPRHFVLALEAREEDAKAMALDVAGRLGLPTDVAERRGEEETRAPDASRISSPSDRS